LTTSQTVTVKVPGAPGHLALLRQVVWTLAARQHFTLDEMDDLRMAVDEAAAQLLRHAAGGPIQMDATLHPAHLEVALSTSVDGDDPIVDESTFAWQILRALANDLEVRRRDDEAVIVFTKHRTVDVPPQDVIEDAS
jgi:serine/threonine-protein kinase RsbW